MTALRQSSRRRIIRTKKVTYETIIEEICEEDISPQFLEITPDIGQVLLTYSSPSTDFLGFGPEMNTIKECVSSVEDSFDDFTERQMHLTNLRNALIELRGKVNLSRRGLLRTVNMCIDTLTNNKSESLTKTQWRALKFVLSRTNESMRDDETDDLEEILLESGLKPIPAMDGIADLYEEP